MQIILDDVQVDRFRSLVAEMNLMYSEYPPEGDRIAKEMAMELAAIIETAGSDEE